MILSYPTFLRLLNYHFIVAANAQVCVDFCQWIQVLKKFKGCTIWKIFFYLIIQHRLFTSYLTFI